MLLVGDFPSASSFCLAVKELRVATVLLTTSKVFNLKFNKASHVSMQSTGHNANIFDVLTELASRRVTSHFLAPNNKLPNGILSTLLISTFAKIDLASYLINAQIRKLLVLLATSSCGDAERGPFAPLVLAQPPDGTREDQIRAKISHRIQFCFHILNGIGVDRKFFVFFAAKISGLVKRSEERI